MEFNKEIDASGLKCPMPILKCKKAMSEIKTGETLKLITTDPSAPKDIQAFCKQTSHELRQVLAQEHKHVFYIQKCK